MVMTSRNPGVGDLHLRLGLFLGTGIAKNNKTQPENPTKQDQ